MEERKKYKVTVRNTGKSFLCAEDEFIFHAMRHALCGPIDFGCAGGGCGICKMRLISGEVHYAKPMSREHITVEEQQQGLVLICCIQPRGEVVIEEI